MREIKGKSAKSLMRSGDTLYTFFAEFIDHVRASDYAEIPTDVAFCKWLIVKKYKTVCMTTMWRTYKKLYPEVMGLIEQLRADCILEGTMLGKYEKSSAMFALKNLCGWEDKPTKRKTEEETQLTVKLVKNG